MIRISFSLKSFSFHLFFCSREISEKDLRACSQITPRDSEFWFRPARPRSHSASFNRSGFIMAGEAVSPSISASSTLTSQFASLMARASQTSSERARQAARLQEQQSSESARIKQAELAAKKRQKHETWNKVLETHHEQVVAASKPPPPPSEKKPIVSQKPKILQPVWTRCLGKVTNRKQRSMTFKKLLKEAAKVDTSTFKLGPKVKSQSRPPVAEKSRTVEKPRAPAKVSTLSPRPIGQKTTISRPEKPSIVERVVASSSTSRSATPQTKAPVKKSVSKPPVVPSLPTRAVASKKTSGKDAKSRLRESFIPNELIPLAQGPRRDLRTIEEIQNDLWRKKGKNYPSVTGNPKEPSRKPLVQTSKPMLDSTQAKSGSTSTSANVTSNTPKKRPRDESEESDEDSFIASSDEEPVAKPEKFDYRAEIRAMFGRKGSSKPIYSDDESDMEATGFEVEREEARAARLARMEDEEEQRREDERIREKKRRKLEAERKKGVK